MKNTDDFCYGKEAITQHHQINTFCYQQRWMEHKGGHYSRSMKDSLYILWYAKRHLLGYSDIEARMLLLALKSMSSQPVPILKQLKKLVEKTLLELPKNFCQIFSKRASPYFLPSKFFTIQYATCYSRSVMIWKINTLIWFYCKKKSSLMKQKKIQQHTHPTSNYSCVKKWWPCTIYFVWPLVLWLWSVSTWHSDAAENYSFSI